MKNEKWIESVEMLREALSKLELEPANRLMFAASAKAFEVSFEYTWKRFKQLGERAGLEVYSPRDAIKAAGQIGLIDDLLRWNDFLNARNLSVHDYVGMSDHEFLSQIKMFADDVMKLGRNSEFVGDIVI
jgi:nucleotidyltransferase substrate binding protein (TIGR01987 family)